MNKKWRQLSLAGVTGTGTNFYKFYGRFEEIGLLHVGLVIKKL